MTFVEVIVAMAIFAILVVAIFPAFMLGVKLNAISKIQVETATVSQTVMEQIYGYSITSSLTVSINTLSTTYPSPVTVGAVTTLTKTTTDYTIIVILTANSPSTGMTKAKVTVTKLDNPYGALPGQAETILIFR